MAVPVRDVTRAEGAYQSLQAIQTCPRHIPLPTGQHKPAPQEIAMIPWSDRLLFRFPPEPVAVVLEFVATEHVVCRLNAVLLEHLLQPAEASGILDELESLPDRIPANQVEMYLAEYAGTRVARRTPIQCGIDAPHLQLRGSEVLLRTGHRGRTRRLTEVL